MREICSAAVVLVVGVAALVQSLLLSRGRLAILIERSLAAAFLVSTIVVIALPIVLPRLRVLLARAATESSSA